MFIFLNILLHICLFCWVKGKDAEIKENFESKTSTITIAFGGTYSFNRAKASEVFDNIIKRSPHAFIWLRYLFEIDDDFEAVEELESLIQSFKSTGSYSTLRKNIYVDGAFSFPDAEEKSLLLDFIDENPDSERRRSKNIKSVLIKANKDDSANPNSIKIILLDIPSDPNSQLIDIDSLKRELSVSNEVSLIVLASPIQILPSDKFYEEHLDKELRFKILELLTNSPVPTIIISSTELVPFGEIIEYPCPRNVGYSLTEITSSGLNKRTDPFISTTNKLLVPGKFNTIKDRTFKSNFGILKIDMNFAEKNPIKVSVELVSTKGDTLISKKDITLPGYQYKSPKKVASLNCTSNLYNKSTSIRTHWRHFIQTIAQPEFRWIIILSVVITLFTLALFFFGLFSMYQPRNKYSVVVDEYTKFHMD